MTARLSVSQAFRRHLLAIATLGALDLIVLIGDAAGHHGLYGFSPLFRLSGEGNVPTLFSALAIAAAALVALRLCQMAGLGKEERAGWRLLAAVFAFMALDELLQLHESLNQFGQRLQATGPLVQFGMLPYVAVALIFAPALLRFWAPQSRPVRNGMTAGGLLCVAAAIGLESLEFMPTNAGIPPFHPATGARFAVEELGEMAGVALLLRTCLLRFAELGGGRLLALVGARPILAIAIAPAPGA